MAHPPQVSVLMPYRNAAATVEAALASILDQRSVKLEVIAVDDGSHDDGAARVAAMAKHDGRLIPLVASGRGIPAALAQALAASRGPLIARMDADDVALPDRLNFQVAELGNKPGTAAVGTQVEVFSEAPIAGGMLRYVDWQNQLITENDHRRDLFVESPLCHASVLLRRRALEEVGGWRDTAWAEDYDLWLRLDAAGWGIAKVPRVLHRWRLHAAQATVTDGRYARPRFCEAKASFLAPKLLKLGRPVLIWGAGPTGKRLARALEKNGVVAERFVDVDPRKVGRTRRRAPVESPRALERGRHTVVAAVGAHGARGEIRTHLDGRGFVEGVDYFCAA